MSFQKPGGVIEPTGGFDGAPEEEESVVVPEFSSNILSSITPVPLSSIEP